MLRIQHRNKFKTVNLLKNRQKSSHLFDIQQQFFPVIFEIISALALVYVSLLALSEGVCLLLFAIHCFNLVQILSCLMISIKLRGKKLGDIPLQSCGYMYFESYFLLMVYF